MLEAIYRRTTKPYSSSSSSSSALIAFEPRQVTLARHMKNSKRSSETLEIDSEGKTLVEKSTQKEKKMKKKRSKDVSSSPLLHSIAAYLENKGFSKTLSVFQSESSIEEVDGLKGNALDLEEMYNKYLETNKCDAKTNNHGSKRLDLQKEEVAEEDKGGSNGNDADAVNEPDRKPKDKKKKENKQISETPTEVAEQSVLEVLPEFSNQKTSAEEKNVKSKDKKRKKSKLTSEEDAEELHREDLKKYNPSKEEKGSKKRKRLNSEENGSQPDEKITNKESKESKNKDSEEEKGEDQVPNGDALQENGGHVGKKRKTEHGQDEANKSLKSSANGSLSNNGKEGSTTEKRKQPNGSAEPKTINAFKRVDVEKVEFVDERLQDNSYWAKDGADIGYGAKAQEVLGQVRGKDFRHEKTKKKRGSYRGGLIDLQSHSIKFNYSDEE